MSCGKPFMISAACEALSFNASCCIWWMSNDQGTPADSSILQGELCCGTPFRDDVARETLSFTLQFVSASTAVYRICVVPDTGEPYVLHEHSSDDFVYMHRRVCCSRTALDGTTFAIQCRLMLQARR